MVRAMTGLILAIVVAGAMPYVLTGIAKVGAFRGRDNARTRDWQAEISGWRKRAHWAHLNAFEALPLFAAAVLAVMIAANAAGNGMDQAAQAAKDTALSHALVAAWCFIGLRISYSVCYIGNLPRLRSTLWFAGIGCVLWLFYIAVGVGRVG